MKTIWKYNVSEALKTNGDIALQFPVGARIVRFAAQHGEPHIWVELDPEDENLETRAYKIVGTGHNIPCDYQYVGTGNIGPFVWHFYRGPVIQDYRTEKKQ